MSTPSREELAQMRHQLANGLLAMTEQMTPIFDTADGIRADLTKRGWSPTAAEQAALTWLLKAIDQAMDASK